MQSLILRLTPTWLTPNHISIVRLICTPSVWYLLYVGQEFWGISLFILLFLTDVWDGTLARGRGQITSLGKVLDPAADKLLFLPSFMVIAVTHDILLVFVVTAIIEFALLFANTGLSLAAKLRGRDNIHGAYPIGKVKTVLQIVGFVAILLPPLFSAGVIVLWLSALAALLNFIEHTYKGTRLITPKYEQVQH